MVVEGLRGLLLLFLGPDLGKNYNPGFCLPVVEDFFLFLATESCLFSVVGEAKSLGGLLLLWSGPWGFWDSGLLCLCSWFVEVKFLYLLWVDSCLDKVVYQGVLIVQDFGWF